MVRVKYINLNSVKSVLFTKLESNMSQRQIKLAYNVDSVMNGNHMPFQKFKSVFPKVTTESLCITENNSVI